MNKLTGTSLALALTLSCGATSALANTMEDKDLAFAFEPEGSMEVVALSEQEMRETEGAVAPIVIRTGVGGVSGGVSYTGGWLAGGYSWNSWDATKAVAGGAVAGLLGTNNWSSMTYGSLAGGVISSSNWSNSPLNWNNWNTSSSNQSSNYGYYSQTFGYCGSCYSSNRR